MYSRARARLPWPFASRANSESLGRSRRGILEIASNNNDDKIVSSTTCRIVINAAIRCFSSADGDGPVDLARRDNRVTPIFFLSLSLLLSIALHRSLSRLPISLRRDKSSAKRSESALIYNPARNRRGSRRVPEARGANNSRFTDGCVHLRPFI